MGIRAWQILIVLLIVILLFGTKKLKHIGGDLGEAIKGFKSGIKDKEDDPVQSLEQRPSIEKASQYDTSDADFIKPSAVNKP